VDLVLVLDDVDVIDDDDDVNADANMLLLFEICEQNAAARIVRDKNRICASEDTIFAVVVVGFSFLFLFTK